MRKSLILLVNICVLFVPVEAQIIQHKASLKQLAVQISQVSPWGM